MPHNAARLSLAIIVSGSLYLLLAKPWSYDVPISGPNLRYNRFQNATRTPTTTKDDRWCNPDECSSGRWTPREPLFTSFSQLDEAYHNPVDRMWEGCRSSAFDDPNLDPSELDRLADERLMQVMNWKWTPYVGKMRPWDPEDFMVRLLKSPGGLILIGDSLSRQHQHTIEYYLEYSGFRFNRNPPHLPMHDHKNVHQSLLKPDEPSTRRVLELAGVPESRLQRPVLTLLEEHMLIGQRDIRAITERLGASKSYYWYHDFQRVPGWEKYVADASRSRQGEEDTVTEDTVVVMNAGAHWSRHELAMLPQRPDRERQALVKETFRQMIKLVVKRLSPIENLTILYRSTSPGHPQCETHTKPYNNSLIAHESEKDILPRLTAQIPPENEDLRGQKARWDWDLFEPRNEMWRRVIESLGREREWRRSRVGELLGAKWFYLDFWDLDLQRPDAHLNPGEDCLHWCRPGVPNEWTHHIYHTLKWFQQKN